MVVACELVQDLEPATAGDHQAQEWPRVETVVLEELQQVVQLDGDVWERTVTQTLGMERIAEYAARFVINDHLPQTLAMQRTPCPLLTGATNP